MNKKFLILTVLMMISLCTTRAHAFVYDYYDELQSAPVAKISDLSNKRVGILTGSAFDALMRRKIEDVHARYYTNYENQVQALKVGEIAAFVIDLPSAKYYLRNQPELKILAEPLIQMQYAMMFEKADEPLKAQFDSVIKKYKNDGTLQGLINIWFGDDEKAKIAPIIPKTGPNGILRVAINTNVPPFVYTKRFKLVGYEIDLLSRIATELGYGVEITNVAIEDVMAGLSIKRYDVGMAGFFVTKDRKDRVLFSHPELESSVVLIVR